MWTRADVAVQPSGTGGGRHGLCTHGNAAATINVASTVTSVNSIKFSWSIGSPLTAYFLVYGQRVTSTRDLPVGNWTLVANSTSTTLTVQNLASNAFYSFSVHSITAAGVDSNQVVYTFQTAAVAGQQLAPGSTCGA